MAPYDLHSQFNKVVIAVLLSLASPKAAANGMGWIVPDSWNLSTGGYTGEFKSGIQYGYFAKKLELGLSFGYTRDQAYPAGILQLNWELHYTPFRKYYFNGKFNPFSLGLHVISIRPDDEGYFIESPDRYPSPDYYDPTSLRLALSLGQSVEILSFETSKAMEAYWWLAATERQLVALYNSPQHIRPKNFISLGLGIKLWL